MKRIYFHYARFILSISLTVLILFAFRTGSQAQASAESHKKEVTSTSTIIFKISLKPPCPSSHKLATLNACNILSHYSLAFLYPPLGDSTSDNTCKHFPDCTQNFDLYSINTLATQLVKDYLQEEYAVSQIPPSLDQDITSPLPNGSISGNWDWQERVTITILVSQYSINDIRIKTTVFAEYKAKTDREWLPLHTDYSYQQGLFCNKIGKWVNRKLSN